MNSIISVETFDAPRLDTLQTHVNFFVSSVNLKGATVCDIQFSAKGDMWGAMVMVCQKNKKERVT